MWAPYVTVLLVLQFCYFHSSSSSRLIHDQCYTKWLSGYKLASGRPSKVLNSVSLTTCEEECLSTKGCAAFAYGVSARSNGTCELATRTARDSRSVSNISLTYEDVNKDHAYDVYIESRADGCLPTSPLFQAPSNHIHNQGIPIDCFYRLMSGKRLAKNHVLKSVSVNNLQDCQEACIAEKGFVCRAISYRYMPSGYTYNVANCELSPFYLVNFDDSARAKYDFVDDYDYDFFQREPHCKTTSSIGAHFGVCAVVSRRGAKLNNLVKSAHAVSTPSQCEHLCTTALFRCRAFSFRHTERGRERDPFHRRSDQQDYDNCFLHDVDVTRLPTQNIVSDPDHDLFEMGRLMGAECVLYDQYVSNRPSGGGDRWTSMHDYNYRPTSGSVEDRYDRDRDRYYNDYHSRRPGNYDRPQDRVDNYPPRPACLVRLKQDQYLAPEQSRATFPVKTVEECRVECLRSMEVLRFPCKTMSFRLTSSTGGSCQLSDMDERQLRPNDFVTARDRYDNAVIYAYDERADVSCRREDSRYYDTMRNYNDNGGRYNGGGTSYYDNNRRYDGGSVRYHDSRYDDRYSSNRYDDKYQITNSRPSYNDYPNRYGGSSSYYDRERDRYPANTKGFYDDRRVDDYNRYGYYLPGQGGSNNRFASTSGGIDRGTTYYRTEDKTVNGERCLRSCRQNREAGFYYCQVDEAGSWDFCCRPDHFCGYSRGLAVPWCYVGSGPSHNIWRSCNHRALSDRNPSFSPTVSYLHDRPPPTINSLTNTEVANLTRDNALLLFKGSPADFKLDGSTSSSETFSTNTTAPAHVTTLSTSNSNIEPVKFGNVLDEDSNLNSNSSSRVNRRTPRKHVRVVKIAKRIQPTSGTDRES